MRFLIDVDGVVADLVSHILNRLNHEFPKLDIPMLADIQSDLFSLETSPLPVEALKYTLDWITTPGFGKDLPLIEGALEGIEKIRKSGHDIFWVTAPWWGAPTWEHDRRHWIAKHFSDNHEKVIFAHAKYVCAGDIFIDDRIKNINEWSAHNRSGLALVYNQPWNSQKKYMDQEHHRFSWDKIDKLLFDLEDIVKGKTCGS